MVINCSFHACVGGLGAALFLWIASVCIYRLYFHPLAKYPGPLLARLTTLYGAYHGWRGDFSTKLYELHEKYGDYVRWTPNYIVVNTAQGFQDVYGVGSKCLKAKNYIVLAQKTPSILTVREPKQHRPRKHRIAQALSDENIRRLEPGMQGHIAKFCDTMTPPQPVSEKSVEGWSPVRDMSKWCNYLLFDMMMSMVFSNPLELVSDERFRHIPDAIHQSSRRQSMYIQSLPLALLAYFKIDEPILRKSVKARDVFVGFIKTVLKTRYKKQLQINAEAEKVEEGKVRGKKAGGDVYSFLNAVDISPAELNAECATMIIAGSDTTATALAATFFYLARYRTAYERAAYEVRSKFSDSSEVKLGALLSSCHFLRASITEAMRLSPPVGISLPRETPPGGAVINGTWFPAGCLVGSGIYSIQHKEAHFSDPHTFRPERWLLSTEGEEVPSDIANHEPAAYGPFQIGSRGCVGKAIALQELLLTMAHVFVRMDFEAVDEMGRKVVVEGSVGKPVPGLTELPIQEFITAQATGPFVRFRRRD
ncbi:cytochrome P450 [Aspergillus venezuelensis]